MHKYRSSARRAAWYDDAEGATNFNPFAKVDTRKNTLEKVSDDDEPSDAAARRRKVPKVSASKSGSTPPTPQNDEGSTISTAWYAKPRHWYLSLQNVAEQQWRHVKGKVGPFSQADVESGLVGASSALALLPPSGDIWSHLRPESRPLRTLFIDYGQQGGVAISKLIKSDYTCGLRR